jgi:hypothetical protein
MGFTSPEEIGPPTRQFKYYFNLDIKVPHPENCQLTIKMKLSVHGILFALGLCTVTTAGVQDLELDTYNLQRQKKPKTG